MSVEVVLVRPGATSYDEEHRVQGVLDLPLCPRGEREAAELADRLAGDDLAGLYCGPGESVLRTAEVVGRAVGLRPRRIVELRNLDQGLWQGLQFDEIRRRNPRLFRQWLDDPRTVCPPRGETVEAALARVKLALRPLIKRHRGERFALVVAEPLAQLVAGYLRGLSHVTLDDGPRTGLLEPIAVAATVENNGQS
jgi:broad specificity phosphatase PhoE